MEESSGTLRKALEDWLEQNVPSGYTSCIKINGTSILPPLMSEDRRIEMRRLRDIAVQLENKITRKKDGIIQDDSAGGEAMYEGAEAEIYFANSLPTSLAPTSEEYSIQSESSKQKDESNHAEQAVLQTTSDMIKEFDPLVGENSNESPNDSSTDPDPSKADEKASRCSEKTSSKPSSAESSVALSYSTDLNNYMDVTESSADLSFRCSDTRSAGGTGTTTPSTVRPDSSDKVQLGMPWRYGQSTYEELSNYLDSLLSNSNCSKTPKVAKDSNQNVVTSSASPQSQKTVTPTGSIECLRPSSSDPPPLTSPGGRLQTRMVIDGCDTYPSQNDKGNHDNSSDFLQNCVLSPVIKPDIQSSYQQKVKLFLENLMAGEGGSSDFAYHQLPRTSQSLKEDSKQPFSSKNLDNGKIPNLDSEGGNGMNQPPPRLVRSNSYTLDSPSPMLLAHIEAELKKNVKNDSQKGERAMMSQSVNPSRRVWDTDTKGMPNWLMKQSSTSTANPKIQSPKKVVNRSVSAQPNFLGGFDIMETSPAVVTKPLNVKVSTNSSNLRRSLGTPHLEEVAEKGPGAMKQTSTTDTLSKPADNEDKIGTLLLQLQLQHNQEMEKLLNRQRKEKEAIRLAMLGEQQVSSRQFSRERPLGRSQSPNNSSFNQINQSPPTQDTVPLTERRNTSPSIYDKEDFIGSLNHLQSKTSALSLDDVSATNNNTILIDLENEKRTESRDLVIKRKNEPQNSSDLTATTYCGQQLGLPNAFSNSTDMISSFPPRDLLSSPKMDHMTSSLPPEILSLHFSNTQLTYQNANTVSCQTQSSSIAINKSITVSADIASVAHNIMSSALTSNNAGGSPQSKRRSWCSRQLFPDDCLNSGPDWVSQSQEIHKHQAASRIQAGVRGYLTRRLLKTERVQNCITTIRDTIVCALQLQRECAPHVEPSDLQLHGRLIQQLSAACEDLHNIFMGLAVPKRMAIIAADRERLRSRTPRSRNSMGSRPLSRATQIAIRRKMNQTDPSDSVSIHSRASSSSRSRRRSWATVESRFKQCPVPTNVANNCEVVSGCLSRSSAPMSMPLQRSASAGSSRKPWR